MAYVKRGSNKAQPKPRLATSVKNPTLSTDFVAGEELRGADAKPWGFVIEGSKIPSSFSLDYMSVVSGCAGPLEVNEALTRVFRVLNGTGAVRLVDREGNTVYTSLTIGKEIIQEPGVQVQIIASDTTALELMVVSEDTYNESKKIVEESDKVLDFGAVERMVTLGTEEMPTQTLDLGPRPKTKAVEQAKKDAERRGRGLPEAPAPTHSDQIVEIVNAQPIPDMF